MRNPEMSDSQYMKCLESWQEKQKKYASSFEKPKKFKKKKKLTIWDRIKSLFMKQN